MFGSRSTAARLHVETRYGETSTASCMSLTPSELACQCLVISTLIAVYPLRLLRNINPSRPWTRPFNIAVPASFDPAPLLYPPIIATLVSLVLSRDRPGSFLPTLILGIACLPRNLIPSTGGLDGSNTAQWFLSSLPLLVARPANTSGLIQEAISSNPSLKPEIVLLIPPLHQTLCATLNSLTTTSLLPAELQLLSMSLINLLFLAKSPQAVILKSLLWGGGIGVLVTCAKILKWGVVLARIPKWRFRRAEPLLKSSARKVLDSKHPFTLRSSVFARNPVVTDSSEDSGLEPAPPTPNLKLNTKIAVHVGNDENGSVSAVEPKSNTNGATSIAGMAESYRRNRRHTLPSLRMLSPIKSAEKTPSGRKKISASSSLQSFFYLTQAQATMRKWLYAGYVYFCLLIIILVGIREYVGRYALSGDEPVGWALGYLFGDVPWFRMKVVSFGLQRWIRLPPRSGLEHQESCYKGWVEHLRHASFGAANTRLILCAYWLAIIIVGLAIVLRLSSIYEVDTRRKVFHFMMVAMLLPATYVDPTFAALALSLMLAIFLLLDLFRASQLPPLSRSLAYFLTPYVDGRDLKGPVVISHIFLLIGCAIPLWLSLASLPRIGTDALAGWEVPSREVSMVSGVICVGMGDAAASLIGRRYGRRKWLWGGGKSIEGSVAFATAVGLALVLAKAWLRIGGWVANNEDSWFMTVRKAGVAAWVASLTEAVLTGGNDNVVVPVVLWLCTKGLDI